MSHVGVWTGVVRGKVVHATVNNAPCWRFAMPIGGDRAGDTQWVNFTLWDERNRAVAEAIVAGSNLTVAGWAKPGVWKDAKGEPQPALYVRCLSGVTFLKGMGRPSDTAAQSTKDVPAANHDVDIHKPLHIDDDNDADNNRHNSSDSSSPTKRAKKSLYGDDDEDEDNDNVPIQRSAAVPLSPSKRLKKAVLVDDDDDDISLGNNRAVAPTPPHSPTKRAAESAGNDTYDRANASSPKKAAPKPSKTTNVLNDDSNDNVETSARAASRKSTAAARSSEKDIFLLAPSPFGKTNRTLDLDGSGSDDEEPVPVTTRKSTRSRFLLEEAEESEDEEPATTKPKSPAKATPAPAKRSARKTK